MPSEPYVYVVVGITAPLAAFTRKYDMKRWLSKLVVDPAHFDYFRGRCGNLTCITDQILEELADG